MATSHTPTDIASRGRYVPPHLRVQVTATGSNVDKHVVPPKPVVTGTRTIRNRITFDVIPPTATAESLLKKVQEGYKKNPEKYRKLHQELFPVLEQKKIAAAQQTAYNFFNKHAKRRLQSDVPMDMLVRGSIPPTSPFYLPRAYRAEYEKLYKIADQIYSKYQRRIAARPKLIEKLTNNKIRRYQERQFNIRFQNRFQKKSNAPPVISSSTVSMSTQTDSLTSSSSVEDISIPSFTEISLRSEVVELKDINEGLYDRVKELENKLATLSSSIQIVQPKPSVVSISTQTPEEPLGSPPGLSIHFANDEQLSVTPNVIEESKKKKTGFLKKMLRK